MSRTKQLGIGVLAVLAVIGICSTAASAASPRRHFHPHVVTACRPNQYVREQQGASMQYYWLRVPHWLNQHSPGCVRTNQRTAFTVTATPPPSYDVTMYPDEIWGCEWGVCTPNSRLPIQVKNVHRMNSVWVNKPTPQVRGMFNVAYDIWLTNKPYTTGRHDGVELMIWLRHQVCCWTKGTVGFPTVQGYKYRLMTRFMHDNIHHASWRYIQFRMLHQRWQVRGFDLAKILQFCLRHHYIRPNQWVESIGAGYEIWYGGTGLSTQRFAVHMNGGSHRRSPIGRTRHEHQAANHRA